jgi:hypothetical protein
MNRFGFGVFIIVQASCRIRNRLSSASGKRCSTESGILRQRGASRLGSSFGLLPQSQVRRDPRAKIMRDQPVFLEPEPAAFASSKFPGGRPRFARILQNTVQTHLAEASIGS